MKIVLMSMPDVAAVIMHESAFHMPNNGIASIGANVDDGHQVTIIDLIRKRRRVGQYVSGILPRIRPDVVGLSAMAWQYDTCTRLIRLIKRLLPDVKIVIGGYHATLMYEEIAASEEAALIDFIVRGEGEEAFRRLVNALRRQRQRRRHPFSFSQEKRRLRSQPAGRTPRSLPAQASDPRQAAAHLGLPHHEQQDRSDGDLPGVHPSLQLLQHEPHVRPDLPPLSAG